MPKPSLSWQLAVYKLNSLLMLLLWCLSGLLPALATTAVSLTAALKQQQQQQTLPEAFKQYDVNDCLQLSLSVLQTWRLIPTMLQQRGAALIQPTLLPMTGLVMAAFRACEAAAPCSAASSSSSSMGLHELAMKQAADTASVLASAFNNAVMTDTVGTRRQLQDHREVLELMMANAAAVASQLYYQAGGQTIVQMGGQAGSSSSSSSSNQAASKTGKRPSSSTHSTRLQKREFPCLHSRLFAALGCAGAAEVLGVPEDMMDTEVAVQSASQACSTLCTALQLLGDPELAAQFDSSSSSRVRQGVQQEQWRQLLTPDVCLGLLEATQLLLLQPEMPVADTALAMAYQACRYTPVAATAGGHERWQDMLWSEKSAAECMRQLLSQVVPAVQHSLQAESSIPEGRRSRAEQESATLYGLGRLLMVVALKGELRGDCEIRAGTWQLQ
jgi:hypothetical protein